MQYANPQTPAFPVADLPENYMGLTKLEYFAARAPAEPQAWFEPQMNTLRPQWPSDIPDRLSTHSYWHAFAAGCDPRWFRLNDTWPENDWLKEHAQTFKAAADWDIDRERQRLIQWPFAWARAVLEAGEKA